MGAAERPRLPPFLSNKKGTLLQRNPPFYRVVTTATLPEFLRRRPSTSPPAPGILFVPERSPWALERGPEVREQSRCGGDRLVRSVEGGTSPGGRHPGVRIGVSEARAGLDRLTLQGHTRDRQRWLRISGRCPGARLHRGAWTTDGLGARDRPLTSVVIDEQGDEGTSAGRRPLPIRPRRTRSGLLRGPGGGGK